MSQASTLSDVSSSAASSEQTTVISSGGSTEETTVTHSVTTVTENVQTTRYPPLVTYCGHEVELPEVGLSTYDVRTVDVRFNNTSTNANCSWIVRPFTANSSNMLVFDKELTWSFCGNNSKSNLSFFDVNPSSGNLNYVNDWCNSYHPSVAGRQGFPTLITFTSQNVTGLNPTLFYYWSYIIPQEECPRTSVELRAGYNQSHLAIPLFRLPNGMSCQWVVKSPEKGVVNVILRNQENCRSAQSNSYFLLMDVGRPQMYQPLKLSLCQDNTALEFSHRSISGQIALAFYSGDVGGSSPFEIVYWAEDMNYLCPTQVMLLTAIEGQVSVIKGVNQAIGSQADRDCLWNIIAQDALTYVELINISNIDYLDNCKSGDYLKIQGLAAVGLCDSDAFPVWSSLFTEAIRFHADSLTPRKEFLIYYTAVKPATCQGHPVSLTVSKQPKTLTESASLGNDTDRTDCLWLLSPEQPDFTVQVSVPIPTGANWDCNVPWLTIEDNPDMEKPQPAPCVKTNAATLIYNARHNATGLLVYFNRRPHIVGRSVSVLIMRYVALGGGDGPTPTGGASAIVVLDVKVWVALLFAVFIAVFGEQLTFWRYVEVDSGMI